MTWSTKRLTTEYVRSIIKSLGCELIGEYVPGHKITVKCLCGHNRDTEYHNFLKPTDTHLCKDCSPANTYGLKTEYVRSVVESFGCELVGEYVGAFTKINVRCPCGNMLPPVLFHSFKRKNRAHLCEKCAKELLGVRYRRIVSDDEKIKRFNDAGFFLVDISEISDTRKKVELMDNDGYMYYASLFDVEQTFKVGQHLRRFSNFNPHTFENMNLWALENNENYRILDMWCDDKKEIVAKLCCNTCKTTWPYRWAGVICNGCVCPNCQMSAGETKINSFLEANSIIFVPQYRFKDCRGIRNPLPFDFYLPEYNALIEYDGILHFYDKFNDSESFEAIQRNDIIKTQYCLDHNIPILRIPYWKKDDIPQILTSYLHLDNFTVL